MAINRRETLITSTSKKDSTIKESIINNAKRNFNALLAPED